MIRQCVKINHANLNEIMYASINISKFNQITFTLFFVLVQYVFKWKSQNELDVYPGFRESKKERQKYKKLYQRNKSTQ